MKTFKCEGCGSGIDVRQEDFLYDEELEYECDCGELVCVEKWEAE